MPTEAGKGEHGVYRIAPELNGAGLQREKHYLGIDAVAWFINKENSFFTDRMASGTLDIKLAGGLEKYQAALGTFELKGGSHVAPVFEHPVLPDRRYRGGPVGLTAALTAIKQDTAIASMLKSAASASLGVVAGMVQTATLAGPAQLLSAAGSDLIAGVKKILGDTAPKREALFDFSGLEHNVHPDKLTGNEIYILLHRGLQLDTDSLTVEPQGELLLPRFGGQPLNDGAWLLLRLRKSTEYSGVRDWFDTAQQWRTNIQALVDDVQLGVITKEQALNRLKPSTSGEQTLFDEFARLRTLIANDGVLTELEARTRTAALRTTLAAAAKAINEQSTDVFHNAITEARESLLGGRQGGESAAAFREAFRQPMPEREEPSGLESATTTVGDVVLLPGVVTGFLKAGAAAAGQ
jgi:hypothetical protein